VTFFSTNVLSRRPYKRSWFLHTTWRQHLKYLHKHNCSSFRIFLYFMIWKSLLIQLNSGIVQAFCQQILQIQVGSFGKSNPLQNSKAKVIQQLQCNNSVRLHHLLTWISEARYSNLSTRNHTNGFPRNTEYAKVCQQPFGRLSTCGKSKQQLPSTWQHCQNIFHHRKMTQLLLFCALILWNKETCLKILKHTVQWKTQILH